jgi:hypothetical protein
MCTYIYTPTHIHIHTETDTDTRAHTQIAPIVVGVSKDGREYFSDLSERESMLSFRFPTLSFVF